MENKDEGFHYTYSAAQRAEVERIRGKYLQPAEDKMARLRKLDAQASQKAQMWSLVIGVIGALVLGTGMSLTMTELGQRLGAPEDLIMVVGIIVGSIGLVLVALAYPVYNRILKKERERIAPEILRLTDELMK